MRHSKKDGQMTDEQPEIESTVETPEVETQENEPGGGFNPAWQGIRDRLPDAFFEAVKPELAKWDQGFQKKVEQGIQSRFETDFGWVKDIAAQGITPDRVTGGLNLLQQLDVDPVGTYNRLGEFLKQNGHLPETPEEVAQVENAGNDDLVPDQDPRDQQIAELQSQLEQLQGGFNEYTQQQQWDADVRAADESLNQQITALRQSHPEMSDDDLEDVIQRLGWKAQQLMNAGDPRIPTVEEAYQEHAAFRDRILSAPRASAAAPRLLPTGGGVPAPNANRPSVGKLSSQDTQNLVSEWLEKNH